MKNTILLESFLMREKINIKKYSYSLGWISMLLFLVSVVISMKSGNRELGFIVASLLSGLINFNIYSKV